MDIRYLLSSHFDYSRTIAADQGPAIAQDYDWPALKLDNAFDVGFDVGVVDNRMQLADLQKLRSLIGSTRSTFVLRIVDPFQEQTLDHLWYRFALELMDSDRVHFMLAYQPAETTAYFATNARRSTFIHAPYVYRPENELPLRHRQRRHTVVHSGALNSEVYPLRSKMWRARSLWPLYGLMSSGLRHPGYPDIGQKKKHDLIGDAYLQHLAQFRFGAVCSSRCRLEFLKYREFAYAGLVPVGDMPATLLDCPSDAWIPWRRNVVALAQRLKTERNTEEMASNFRRFMRARRDVFEMRAWVNKQIAAVVE